jgi:hypothetical protein
MEICPNRRVVSDGRAASVRVGPRYRTAFPLPLVEKPHSPGCLRRAVGQFQPSLRNGYCSNQNMERDACEGGCVVSNWGHTRKFHFFLENLVYFYILCVTLGT